jgi:hypothetical protein
MILRTFTQFDQNAAGGLGMQKGDPGAAGPDPGGVVDELDILFLEFFERRVDVGDPEGNMRPSTSDQKFFPSSILFTAMPR